MITERVVNLLKQGDETVKLAFLFTDVASGSSYGHQMFESKDCEPFLSSKAFLNFRFDRDAIMKTFDY